MDTCVFHLFILAFFVFSPICVVNNDAKDGLLVTRLRESFRSSEGVLPVRVMNDLLEHRALGGKDTGRLDRLIAKLIVLGLGVFGVAHPSPKVERSVFLFCFHPDVITLDGFSFSQIFTRKWEAVVVAATPRPTARPHLAMILPSLKGRKRVTDRLLGFLDVLQDFFDGRGVQAHPRLTDDTNYVGGRCNLRLMRDHVRAVFGESVAISTIHTYLKPVRLGSRQARRHKAGSSLANYRCVVPTRDGRNMFHVDAYYCHSQNKALKQLFYLLQASDAGERVTLLSRDDRGRLYIFGSSVARPSATWTVARRDSDNGSLGESLPSHDFAQTKDLSITATGTLVLRVDTPANSGRRHPSLNGGRSTYMLKGTEWVPSTPTHFADLTVWQLLTGQWGTVTMPTCLLLLVDGGQDETMAHKANQFVYVLLSLLLDFDTLVVAKYHPNGGSKFNPSERPHSSVSNTLSGAQLVSDSLCAEVGIGLNGERLPDMDEAAKARLIGSALEAANVRLSDARFSGWPVSSAVWPARTKRPVHLSEDLEDVLQTLRDNKFVLHPQSAFRRKKISLTEAARSGLSSRYGRSLPATVTVGQVLRVLFSPHTHIGKHLLITARCGDSSCDSCGGAYHSGEFAEALLGSSEWTDSIRRVVEPALEDDSSTYVSTDTRIANGPLSRVRDVGRSSVEPCPSVLVDRAIEELVESRGKPTAGWMTALATSCAAAPGSDSFAKFKRFVEHRYEKAVEKKNKG
jgi:hypothetical protein